MGYELQDEARLLRFKCCSIQNGAADMSKLTAGQVVRIVGQPLARTRLQAFSVREVDVAELQKRNLFLSHQSLIATKSTVWHSRSPAALQTAWMTTVCATALQLEQ